MTKEIISVTSDREKVRKEIRLCDEVSDDARKMKEQLKEMKEREQGKVKDKKSKEKKNKEMRCDR